MLCAARLFCVLPAFLFFCVDGRFGAPIPNIAWESCTRARGCSPAKSCALEGMMSGRLLRRRSFGSQENPSVNGQTDGCGYPDSETTIGECPRPGLQVLQGLPISWPPLLFSFSFFFWQWSVLPRQSSSMCLVWNLLSSISPSPRTGQTTTYTPGPSATQQASPRRPTPRGNPSARPWWR